MFYKHVLFILDCQVNILMQYPYSAYYMYACVHNKISELPQSRNTIYKFKNWTNRFIDT